MALMEEKPKTLVKHVHNLELQDLKTQNTGAYAPKNNSPKKAPNSNQNVARNVVLSEKKTEL
ncbi:4163_t:CDS:2, partial [Dentiscutata heterogama]